MRTKPSRSAVLVASAALVAACGGAVPTAEAGGVKTRVHEVTGWSGDGQGQRVIEVQVSSDRTVTCIEDRLNVNTTWPSNSQPRTSSVALSCDWSPK